MNLNKLRIRSKIILGNGIALALMVAIIFVIYGSINKLQETSKWLGHTHKVIGEANLLTKVLIDMETGQRGFLITGKDEFLKPYNSGKHQFIEIISRLEITVSDNPEQVARLRGIADLEGKWQRTAAEPEISKRREVNRNKASTGEVVALVEAGLGKEAMNSLRKQLDKFIAVEEELMVTRKAAAKTRVLITSIIVFAGTALALGSAFLLLLFIARKISDPINELVVNLQKMTREGDFSNKVNVSGADEVAELGKSFNSIIDHFKQMIDHANRISLGDYTADIQPRSNKDELGVAMGKMINTLREVTVVAEAIAEGNYKLQVQVKSESDLLADSVNRMSSTIGAIIAENKQQNWIKTGQYEINEKMLGDLDEKALGENVITFLAKYLGAQIGALYLLEEENDFLKLVGSYAFSKRKDLNERIKIGEGLVGQAAFEKELISVTNLPEDYTRIGSAIGNTSPRNVVVSPFMMKGELRGVIELGAIKEFSDSELELLKATMENIAVNFNSTQANSKMKYLLEETQRQAEELEAQQEELRQSNENLESQSNNLRRVNDDLEIQKAEIQAKNREVEEKARELAVSSKYKSEFLANMSHELRTPLNSLLLLSNSLARNKEGNLNEEQVQSASIIHSGGNDLLNLINEILDLSKIEAGMMEVEFKAVGLREVTDELERNFKHVCEDKGLKLDISIDPALPPLISTDQYRLGQILKNLMSNAIKFTKEGGVSVEFTNPVGSVNLFRSGLEPEEAFCINVKDTGIGVSEEKIKVIFEAFQQAEGGTERKYGGTGLGLSISRELAALLGGEIQVKSRLGEGTTFSLYLPLDAESTAIDYSPKMGVEPAELKVDSIKETPVFKRTKKPKEDIGLQIKDDRDSLEEGDNSILLVIEDDLRFAKILVDQCHNQNLKCLTSSTGEEGLILAEKYLPDGIILDLHLPGVDGWSVLNTLKDNPKTRHIPVHIMSVEGSEPEAAKRGAIGFLTKPVNQEELEGALNRIQSFTTKAVKDLLVIEDSEATQEGVRQVMGDGDVKITRALSGKEGIEALKVGNFDCVILDLGLPDMDGFELLEKLMLEKKLRIPPIIVYTGKELSRSEHKKLLKYADSIIVKGVDSDERLLDDTSLFLHRVVDKLPSQKQKIIHSLYDIETVFKDRKVLVVDDDMRNVFAVSRLLQEKGVNVLVAEDGQLALDILEKESDVDLVLMDIMMPVMDGYETTRRIREQEEFKKIPIIALTAKAMKEDRAKCIAAGASDYLAKPVEEQRLFSIMRIWLYR